MTYPQQQSPIWQQYPVAPPKKAPKTGLIVGIAAAAVVVTGGALAVTVAITTSGGSSGADVPQVDPDPFSAQAGDCISADEDAGSNGAFSASAVRVHCSDSSANYSVIAQLASASGSDCNTVPGYEYGNPVVYDFKSGESRELCVMPRG
ncbi:hypothetical protein NQK81_00510 [Amycolatopsis roodepoortensis]|uniref:LppU/SCO3897 family protein n=1 Tax=Amycolatopsis roodepoortensis TaxID=700274 RepID=UPI00214B8BF7|nr:hypothetical protein [Amycolatopsis roodepoortensis]UUV31961.1 hypothetical protein NQK81_00510 [Amycolatopsis roodepoortensis]